MELIVVIVLILIIAGLITTSVMSYIKTSKETSFELLEKSIKSSAETIYLDNEENIDDNKTISFTISKLKEQGYIELEDLTNPINNKDISECEIIITKAKVQESNKWKYQITSTNNDCPCYGGACN